MNGKYDECEKDSPRWQAALEEELTKQVGTDFVLLYRDLTFAFPSQEPHPSPFDYPRIDKNALQVWASDRGWEVQMVP